MASKDSALVVGAGMEGLATAWHLQEHGFDVTVVDRKGVAAGSSWGNAGWLTPVLAMPLSEPGLWTYGPRALLDRDAALHVPVRADPPLWSFLARFMGHATPRAWDRTMAALAPLDRLALDAYDEIVGCPGSGGSAGPGPQGTSPTGMPALMHEGPFVIGFEDEKQAAAFDEEMAGVRRHGQDVPLTRLADPRELAPHLSDAVPIAYRLDGQRFIEPGPFVHALGREVEARGAHILMGTGVIDVRGRDGTHDPGVVLDDGRRLDAHALILATGAWLPGLARRLGVRTMVQAGRGYSFTVPTDPVVEHPVYLPDRRLACSPYQGRFRIAGTMEFRGPDEALQQGRVRSMVAQARHLFRGVDMDAREDEWVGSRPVTPDGVPLAGATRADGVYVAGGHGMWGIVLGPVTGKLLAEQIATGTVPDALRPLDPLR